MRRPAEYVLVFGLVFLAGCASNGPRDPAEPDGEARPTYAIAPPERLVFTRPDGVELVATLWRPEGLERAPVILQAQPYAAGCSPPGSQLAGDPYPAPCRPGTSDEYWLGAYHGLPRALIEDGFAFVDLNVRGTGESDGCLTINGPDESDDLVAVIAELAAAPWSTGSVGMMGLSYMGTTPFVALTHRPPALKVVVAGGILTNEYNFWYTPQGAHIVTPDAALFSPLWLGSVVLMPQLGAGPSTAPDAAENYAQRYCPEFIEMVADGYAQAATEDRDRDYYLDRRYIDTLQDQEAAVLVVQGLDDRGGGMQVEPVWQALEGTPRAMVLGQWPHTFPDSAMLEGSQGLDWPALPLAWFDHFLRGGPPPSVLGQVHHETTEGKWLVSDAWPASPGEALWLDGDLLRAEPGSQDIAFRSSPRGTACSDADGAWAVAMTEPLAAAATLAGNPMAWLQVEVDQPAAVVAIDLWDVPGNDVCAGRLLTHGAADLRYREDPFQGRDVPTGEPLGTRIDLFAVATEVPAGHRIAATFSASGTIGAQGRPSAATVTLLGGESHLVVPTSGVGGPLPGIAYPPMPLGPDWQGAS